MNSTVLRAMHIRSSIQHIFNKCKIAIAEEAGAAPFQTEFMDTTHWDRKAQADCVFKTPVCYWSPEMTKAACQGYESLLGTVQPKFEEFSPSLWLFDSRAIYFLPNSGLDPLGIGIKSWLAAACVADNNSVLTIWAPFIEELDSPEAMSEKGTIWKALPKVRIVPIRDFDNNDALLDSHSAALFHALMMWLKLPFVGTETLHHSRADRRRAERDSVALPEIKTVLLRRAAHRSQDGNGGANREYSCQWVVNGHWRRLHEPRRADGAQVTYVTPHVKGPEGKPLRAPRETVYLVTR